MVDSWLRRKCINGLLASSASALVLKNQPVMKLRGGLGGLDGEQVAKVVMGISAANGGVMALAPKKAGEGYGVAETKWTTFFAQWAGIIMFGQSLTAFLALGGMDVAEAVGWGFIPSCVTAIQDLLNDRMVGEMGMSGMAKVMPVVVNLLLTGGVLGKIPNFDAGLAMKITAAWMGANGLAGYFATDAWLDGWGGSGLTAVDKGMGKLFAQTMMGSAAYIAANVFGGMSALESFGIMMAVYVLGSVDGLYISKTIESMGVDPPKALFWAALQLGCVATIFL